MIAPRKTRARPRPSELPELILGQMRESVIVTDLEGRVIYWNRVAAAIFGYTSAEMIGTPLSRIIPTSELKSLRSNFDQIRAGRDFSGEWEALRKDSRRIYLETHRTLLKNSRGTPMGILGISRDITRQKKEGEAIRQSEQLYRAVGESIDFGVWSCDSKGRLTHLSDSFMRLLGLTSSQNLADAWLNALDPKDRETIMPAWKKCFEDGKPWSRRYRIRGADGDWHLVHTFGAPVRDEKGKILCWAGLNLDASQL